MSDLEKLVLASGRKDVELENGLAIFKEYGDRLLLLFEKAKKNFYSTRKYNLTLATAHSSKGLEFDVVTIDPNYPDLSSVMARIAEEYRIKNLSTFYNPEKNLQLDSFIEEVNLFYVAITRTKRILFDKSGNAKTLTPNNPNAVKSKLDSMLRTLKKAKTEEMSVPEEKTMETVKAEPVEKNISVKTKKPSKASAFSKFNKKEK